MTDNISKRITFTEILYSVVIATALTRLSFDISLRNAMLLFAIVIILSDWVEYIANLGKTDETVSNIRIFAADMLVLFVWNTIVIIPSEKFVWYVAFLGIFFASQQIWELVAGRYSPLKLLIKPTTGLIVAYVTIAVSVDANLVEPYPSLVLCVILFVAAKIPAWLEIRDMDRSISI